MSSRSGLRITSASGNGSATGSGLSVKRILLASCLILFFAVAPLSILVLPARAATTSPPPPPVYYVSPTGSDTTGNGSISSPFATISHAVAVSTAGATVIVEPGTYPEMVVIPIQLKLISQSSEPSNTVINAAGKINGIAVVGSASAGTIVEGFTVENANDEGIYVQDSSGVVVENNVVSHNSLSPFPGVGEAKGIQLTGTVDSSVADNTVVGNEYGGIGITDDGPVNPSWNVTAAPHTGVPANGANPGNDNVVSGNFVLDNHPNHCAIVISSYNPNEGVSNNIVSFNTIVDNQNGVIIAADTPNTTAVNNTILSNSILNNGEGGVVVHSNALGDVVTGNVIMDNVFSADGYLPTLEGIIVGGVGPVPVQVTTISGNTFQNEAIGIQIVNAKTTLVSANVYEATVKLPVNGTVTTITSGSPSGSGSGVTTVTQTSTVAQTVAATTTQTVTTAASAGSSSSGGLSFSVALVTAVGTLIVGLIAGMVVRPIRESAGR